MSELMTDERTRDTFATLRADELGRVRPPGAAVVHRAVRRRRIRRVAVGTGMAGVVLAAAGSALPAGIPAPYRATRHPVGDVTGAAVGPGGPAGLDDNAAVVLLHRTGSASPGDIVLRMAGGSLRRVSSVDLGESQASSDYQLRFVCVGADTGRYTVTFAVGLVSDRFTGRCVPGGDGRDVTRLSERAYQSGQRITVRIDPGTVQGPAVFAYELVQQPGHR